MTINECSLVRVADGDTITVAIPGWPGPWDRVRLLGIDAPERGRPGWHASREYLAHLCRQGAIGLEAAEPGPLTRGRCNRLLAWVWCGGLVVNVQMVRDGYALPHHKFGRGTYSTAIDDARQIAIEHGRDPALGRMLSFGPKARPLSSWRSRCRPCMGKLS